MEGRSSISSSGLKIPCLIFQHLFPTLVIEKAILEMVPLKMEAASFVGMSPRRALHSHQSMYKRQIYLYIVKPLGILRLLVIAAKVIYPNRDVYIRSEVLPLNICSISVDLTVER